MKAQLIAVAIASGLTLAGGVLAASKDKEMEAVVMVTKFDPATRTVQIQTKSRQAELQLGPNIDVSNIQEGNRYQLRWVQATATAVEPGAQATGGATAEKAGSGGIISSKRAGIVEKVDAANKEFTLRTTKGESETFTMGEGVSAESLKPGEAVTVAFQRPVVSQLRSTPQPISDPYAPQ